LYLEKLFVCRKNHKNGQIWTIGGNGTFREAVGPQDMPADAMWHHPMPHLACHITDPRDCQGVISRKPLHAWSNIGLIRRWTLSSHGSLGPLSLTRKAQTNLQIVSPGGKITYLPCNHHLEAIQCRGMVRQCNGRSAKRGQCRPMPHRLIFAYKYPHALYTL